MPEISQTPLVSLLHPALTYQEWKSSMLSCIEKMLEVKNKHANPMLPEQSLSPPPMRVYLKAVLLEASI